MLDLIKSDYKFLYNILNNVSNNHGCGHAFLFDSCSDLSNNIVMYFAKMLLCPYGGINAKKCSNCFLCKQIDDGNFLDLKIIDGTNNIIKKEDILSLQEEFSTISISNVPRVYIIKHIDNITSNAANALLKFLEEPYDNVIAILMADNIKTVFPTIVSRCQIVRVNNLISYEDNATKNLKNLGIIDEDFDSSLISDAINIIKFFENNGLSTIIYYKDLLKNFSEREKVSKLLDFFIYFYFDILVFDINCNKNYCFSDYLSDIKNIMSINSKDSIQRKLEILFKSRENFKYNVNINLFIDCLIIDLYGGV